MAALPWVFGAIIGMVMWSAIRRLPGEIAKWLCSPFGNSSRHMLVALTFLSFAFLVISGLIVQMGLIDLFGAGTDMLGYPDRKRIGGEVFAASLIGYLVLQIFLRLDQLRTAHVSKKALKKDQ